MRHNSTVLFRGPSRFDGQPIVALYTERSKNEKTGPMGQLAIMLEDVHPTVGVKSGLDISVCGGCGLAGDRGCYVNTLFGPGKAWKAYKAGNANKFDLDYFKMISDYQPTRLGSYGDPAAIPRDVLNIVIGNAGHTGYTSSWQRDDVQEYRDILSASVHTMQEYEQAKRIGWKVYFTPLDGTDPSTIGLTLCPASVEAKEEREHAGKPKRVDCANCLLCNGTSKHCNDIYSPMHGGPAVKAKIRKHEKAYAIGM